MIIGVVEGYTKLHAHTICGYGFSQGLCGTCIRMLLFEVITVGECAYKVGDNLHLSAPFLPVHDFFTLFK